MTAFCVNDAVYRSLELLQGRDEGGVQVARATSVRETLWTRNTSAPPCCGLRPNRGQLKMVLSNLRGWVSCDALGHSRLALPKDCCPLEPRGLARVPDAEPIPLGQAMHALATITQTAWAGHSLDEPGWSPGASESGSSWCQLCDAQVWIDRV